MDKQKQIEEISELISNYYHNGSFVRKGSLSEMIYDKLFPKDSVVLSKEEYEHINSCYSVIRKETAEKFAERVKMAFYYEFDELIPSIMADKIDEICKEITEGEQGKLDEQKNCIYEQRKELDFVWWECSACGSGFNFYVNTPYENRFHYCPYCGAKIVECKELQNERND